MPATHPPRRRRDSLARAALLLVVFVVMAKCAWVGDDAFITMRTVDNLLEGRGLTWNAGERVQAFTHPLWLFVLTGFTAAIPDPYWAIITASLSVSVLGVAILLSRVAGSLSSAALAAGILIVSKWWIDYSSSGLENPLLYLLAACFVFAWTNAHGTAAASGENSRKVGSDRTTFQLSALTALAAITRPDSVLLFGPPLIAHVIIVGSRTWRPLLQGMSPLLAWEMFSIIWFGFPVANTAYAKLNTGIPATELIEQGVRYLEYSSLADPILASTIVVGAFATLFRRPRVEAAFAIGIALHVLYVLRIGGGFMGGRFLTLPFFLTVCLFARSASSDRRRSYALAGFIALGLLVPRNPVLSEFSYVHSETHAGITDERGHYYAHTGLWHHLRGSEQPHEWAIQGRSDRAKADATGEPRFRVRTTTGFYGYEVGPLVYVVDRYALSSPFLARLPADPTGYQGGWRIGHFDRAWPAGFDESTRSGENRLVDPDLRTLYDDMRLVTTGSLWSADRWRAIWRLNTP